VSVFSAPVNNMVHKIVHFLHGVDPYFHLPMSESADGRQKIWFFPRNNADAPLPIFTVNLPVPHPNWEYGVARRDLRKLQPMGKVVSQL
jgi:hypothetical protein